MILKLLTFLFEKLIGRLPEEQRDTLRKEFGELLVKVIEAGAKGAAEGAAKGLADKMQ